LVAASTITFLAPLPSSYASYYSFAPALLLDVAPSIYINSSALTLLLLSHSSEAPRYDASESISSINIVVGA